MIDQVCSDWRNTTEKGNREDSGIYLMLFIKDRQFTPIYKQDLILQHSIAEFYMQLYIYLNEPQ